MAGYTIRMLDQIPDISGDYPGEMRMSAAGDLGNEQVAFMWRRMPAETGGKGSYGHRHKTVEEIYFVIEGTIQFKLEDEIVVLTTTTMIRSPMARGPMVFAAIEAYRLTNQDKYADIAGHLSAWFFGLLMMQVKLCIH